MSAEVLRSDRAAALARVDSIRDQLEAAGGSLAEAVRVLALAYSQRDWLSLGQASFAEYVKVHFADWLAEASTKKLALVAVALRMEGLSQRAIAAATDQPQSTVRDQLSRSHSVGPERITGMDGRSRTSAPRRSAAASAPPAPGPVNSLWLQLDGHMSRRIYGVEIWTQVRDSVTTPSAPTRDDPRDWPVTVTDPDGAGQLADALAARGQLYLDMAERVRAAADV